VGTAHQEESQGLTMPNIPLLLFWVAVSGFFAVLSIHTWDVRKKIRNGLSDMSRAHDEHGHFVKVNTKPLEEILLIEIAVFLVSCFAAFADYLGLV
jgi:hypothetical protein